MNTENARIHSIAFVHIGIVCSRSLVRPILPICFLLMCEITRESFYELFFGTTAVCEWMRLCARRVIRCIFRHQNESFFFEQYIIIYVSGSGHHHFADIVGLSHTQCCFFLLSFSNFWYARFDGRKYCHSCSCERSIARPLGMAIIAIRYATSRRINDIDCQKCVAWKRCAGCVPRCCSC